MKKKKKSHVEFMKNIDEKIKYTRTEIKSRKF